MCGTGGYAVGLVGAQPSGHPRVLDTMPLVCTYPLDPPPSTARYTHVVGQPSYHLNEPPYGLPLLPCLAEQSKYSTSSYHTYMPTLDARTPALRWTIPQAPWLQRNKRNTRPAMDAPRGVLNGGGGGKCSGFPKKPGALHVRNHGWWQLAVGGWRRLAVGSWQQAVGGGWWGFAAVGGWWLVVGGGWQWLAVGDWSPLVVGGGWLLVVVAVGGWRLVAVGS